MPRSRLLGILLDINNCPQIPAEKRINVALPSSEPNGPQLDIDQDPNDQAFLGAKKLETLLSEVPHMSCAAAKDANPSLAAELEKPQDEPYPAHFLSPDDVDNYLHVIDSRLDPDTHIPTLAPLAHPNDHPPLHPLLRNPNSSTSWLRRHAPQIFLQGNEGADGHAADDDEGGHGAPGTGRKSRGGARGGERGGRGGSTRGKKASAAASGTPRTSLAGGGGGGGGDVSMDDDAEGGRGTPAPKGKRKRDDDPGYRPKGGSGTRPSKKKRKSEGGDGTPTAAKKAKKETPTVDGGD